MIYCLQFAEYASSYEFWNFRMLSILRSLEIFFFKCRFLYSFRKPTPKNSIIVTFWEPLKSEKVAVAGSSANFLNVDSDCGREFLFHATILAQYMCSVNPTTPSTSILTPIQSKLFGIFDLKKKL